MSKKIIIVRYNMKFAEKSYKDCKNNIIKCPTLDFPIVRAFFMS